MSSISVAPMNWEAMQHCFFEEINNIGGSRESIIRYASLRLSYTQKIPYPIIHCMSNQFMSLSLFERKKRFLCCSRLREGVNSSDIDFVTLLAVDRATLKRLMKKWNIL